MYAESVKLVFFFLIKTINKGLTSATTLILIPYDEEKRT